MEVRTANNLSIDDFFDMYAEFRTNPALNFQMKRCLRILCRHPESIPDIVDQFQNEYSFELLGATRTYKLVFDIENGDIVLKYLL